MRSGRRSGSALRAQAQGRVSCVRRSAGSLQIRAALQVGLDGFGLQSRNHRVGASPHAPAVLRVSDRTCALFAAIAARSLGSALRAQAQGMVLYARRSAGSPQIRPAPIKKLRRPEGRLIFFGLDGFEPSISWSRTKRASHCATARKKIPPRGRDPGATGLEPAIFGLTGRRDKPASLRPQCHR